MGPWVGKIPWRREQQPTPVFLPGKFHEQRSLVGYSSWGHKESDTTERLTFHFISFPRIKIPHKRKRKGEREREGGREEGRKL